VALWLDVDPHSGVPLYVQLVEQVKRALEVGALRAGDSLPTVRQLAGQLTLAPNTIMKAYNELQRLGLIESRPGVGTVVLPGAEGALREEQLAALFGRLRTLVTDASALGVPENELRARFEMELQRRLAATVR
jgi:GntR family transcriptional regulator